MNPQQMPEEQDHRNIFGRVWDKITGNDNDYEYEEEHNEAVVKNSDSSRKTAQSSLRLQTARMGRVAVRARVQVYQDAVVVADGLKIGEQQIVNLESATAQEAERIIDFLTGVCYALDGTAKRVGDRVFLFAPANMEVDSDQDSAAAAPASPVSPRP